MIKKVKQFLSGLKSNKSIYKIVGEEKGCFDLVKNFYDFMESSPDVKDCLHVHNLDEQGRVDEQAKKKLFMFLCGWFGGPNLFVDTYGHPRMRARHMHIKIEEKHRSQWIRCMEHAIKNHSTRLSKKNKSLILNSFVALSLRIKNQTT